MIPCPGRTFRKSIVEESRIAAKPGPVREAYAAEKIYAGKARDEPVFFLQKEEILGIIGSDANGRLAERSIAAVLKCNRFRGVYSPPISTKREHRSPKSSAETPDFRQKAVNFGHYAKPRERLAISTKAPPICGNSQIFLQIVSGGKFAGKTQYFQWKVGREDEGARLENVKRQKRSGVRIPYLPPIPGAGIEICPPFTFAYLSSARRAFPCIRDNRGIRRNR